MLDGNIETDWIFFQLIWNFCNDIFAKIPFVIHFFLYIPWNSPKIGLQLYKS